ncbi:6,7-dimethyl-8-ribityllumazine synthase [Chitinasiproducens palmae]|uniref:6,7-dimethyl-8-ribityllumazine synthase n=1 Tax=Chitinasiproducens palmae TaxID=1770053 RepID=A0A1H2PW50_9BURK|nr:6,7-dimethyl-8-ribityllumazine synthase [Chitinasiproducens palmae]SDV51537.1 6,7-dimethyl-8-ribityllumazine synthase [Chitinasiproducens palmae]
MRIDAPADRPRIAFIQSCWHRDLVDRCRDAFLHQLAAAGIDPTAVACHEVPGAFELPLLAKRIARCGAHDAIIAAGLVVDGGIYRHEFVAQAVISGLMQVQLETLTPVFSAVLTPHQFHGGAEHIGFFSNHMAVKGREVADACVATLAAHAAA